MIRCLCALLLPALLSAGWFHRGPSKLERKVDRILAGNPAAERAYWGILIKDLDSGRVVLGRNPDRLFVPASNTKLFTSALALTRLGPEHVVRTRVLAASGPDAAGTVNGDLILLGGGDPNLSARILPFHEKDAFGENPLASMERLADDVCARGVRRIIGDIVGDDTAYVWEPFAAGWAWDDAAAAYGAAVSALSVNDSSISLTVTAGANAGDAATLLPKPPVEGLVIHNHVRTIARGDNTIRCVRMPLSPELIVSGEIQAGTSTIASLAVDRPALFAARVLRQALESRGVRVDGAARARHRLPGERPVQHDGVELAARDSAPLAEILQVVDKVSQNLHAEMVLREVSRAGHGAGSREEGLDELSSFLGEIGVTDAGYTFEDGSGLSHLNLVAPSAVLRLLEHMYRSPLRDRWVALLPVGGIDGSLATRFGGDPRGASVHAKTGTMNHVSALSGYLLPPNGSRYVFSVLVNGYICPPAEIRAVVDKILMTLLERDH